ncbi:amidohydrolase [Candidatus Poribacteria bacterium]|nr:amidohydrolase [Candidatus Poribacteria bacterium]
MLIDTQVHVGLLYDRYPPLTPKMLLDWMDANDIAMSAPLPLESPEAVSYYITSFEMIALAKEHPDRFLPFCVMDPRMSTSGAKEGPRNVIRRYVEMGAVGFGEVIPPLPIDHPLQMDVFAACDEFRLPVVLHMDSQYCTDNPNLDGLERVLRAFPSSVFIGHGPGFWAPISGDVTEAQMGAYPKGPVRSGGAVERLMTTYANLWADLSAGSGHNAIARDWEHGKGFLERHHRKLLFATDYLYPGQPIPHFEMLAEAGVSTAARERIESANARELFRF